MNNTNLTDTMQSPDSPVYRQQKNFVNGVQFESQYEVQTRRVQASQIYIRNFVQLSSSASATGTIGNGTTLTLTSTLSPQTPHQFDPNFAVPFVALYQGTVAIGSAQLYPKIGSGITPGAYTIQGGLDYHTYDGTNSVWGGAITDNSAGNQTILFVTQWKWIWYNNGTVT
jgi:hypothetical protein